LWLSVQIRATVYEYVFCGSVVKVQSHRRPRYDQQQQLGTIPLPSPLKCPWRTPLSLVRACDQIHYEATSIAYSNCEFDLTTYSYLEASISGPNCFFIELITVKRSFAQWYIKAYNSEHIDMPTLKLFPSLRHLRVHGHFESTYVDETGLIIYPDIDRDMLFGYARAFFGRPGLEIEVVDADDRISRSRQVLTL
jgi:hypothetical protein